jgi:hypothetical protein
MLPPLVLPSFDYAGIHSSILEAVPDKSVLKAFVNYFFFCLFLLLFLCSEEEMLKKLGYLMNESHYSCSVLYECRYILSVLINFYMTV